MRRRTLLSFVAVALADLFGRPVRTAAACRLENESCATDADCCHLVCDAGVCRDFVEPCKLADGSNGRALGAPCDGPDSTQCCWGAVCTSTEGTNFPGGLPPYTCQRPDTSWRCPDGRRPCRNRAYSAMGPRMCCHGADTCSGDDRGCLTTNPRKQNEHCQDVYGNGTCDGQWGFATMVVGGTFQCVDFEGMGSCEDGGTCTSWNDCGPCGVCIIEPPGCCQNPNFTRRRCAKLKGCVP